MSTDIKPGQVWAPKKHPTQRIRVNLVRPAHIEFKWVGGISDIVRTEEFLSVFELVNDTTPAPLDPTLVKAGDTVTLLVKTTDLAGEFSVTGKVYRHSPYGPDFVGGHALAHEHSTLTAHQPAPKPEWKPGTTGTATVETPEAIEREQHGTFVQWGGEGMRFVLDTPLYREVNLVDPSVVTDFVPDETRPLPEWRKIRDALREGTAAAYPGSVEKTWSDIDETTLHHYDQMATAVEALLRGESR